MKLRLGTRGSALAKAQSKLFADALCRKNPGLEIETVVIKTSGDRLSAEINEGKRAELPASQEAPNVKAMFVKEIESALLDETIDFAVHSAKDLPAELPPGLMIAAYPIREDPRDVIIGSTLEALPHCATVGTSSLRRQFQLMELRPDLKFIPIHGNVDTRLKKLENNGLDAIMLAEAGLRRLGLDSLKRNILGADIIVPAPGQGALAIETRVEGPALKTVQGIDDPDSRREVELERAVLARLGGGCSTPLGVLARVKEGQFSVWSFWADGSGQGCIRSRMEGAESSGLIDRVVSQLTDARP